MTREREERVRDKKENERKGRGERGREREGKGVKRRSKVTLATYFLCGGGGGGDGWKEGKKVKRN